MRAPGRWAFNQETVADMTTLTITLDEDLDADLREAAASSGLRKAEFVRDALRRQLALMRLGVLQGQLAPYARACGWATDEDVFREVS